jgi:hypothetical protein
MALHDSGHYADYLRSRLILQYIVAHRRVRGKPCPPPNGGHFSDVDRVREAEGD